MNNVFGHIFTKEEIFQQLEYLHAPTDSVVLMHSSLRAIGPIEGGAEALLDYLIEYFTREGGLFCVPTHTWHNLGKEITLDLSSDESCLGAFAGVAIRDPRGIRSENPSHSIVVFGDREKALEFVRDELWVSSPIAPESCYGRIIEMGGHVLLVGVAHDRNTCLHTVDEMLGIPNRMDDRPVPVAVRKKDGQVVRSEMKLFYTDYTDDISYRFPKYETALRYHRCIADGFIGNAPTQLCDTAKMKEIIARMYEKSGGVDILAGDGPIAQKLYCVNG